jgi:hypothetical protein
MEKEKKVKLPDANQALKNIESRKRVCKRYLDKAINELYRAEQLTDEIFIRAALVQKRNEITFFL